MQGGWQPPSGGGGGYGGPPGGSGYGQPPPGAPGGTAMGGPPPGYGPQPGFTNNPYGAPGAPPGMGGAYGSYEFNDTENAVIDKTAGRTSMWGWISAILGGLMVIFSICGAIANPVGVLYLPMGVVSLIVGITFIGVGKSLKSVVNTQGADMPHMMQAMQKLGSAFLIQSISTLVMIALSIIGGIIIFFFVLAVAATGVH